MSLTWDVTVKSGSRKVEFVHGTTTGKRIFRIDGNELRRKDWMFKLSGTEEVEYKGDKFRVDIKALPGDSYAYTLSVNGKALKRHHESVADTTCAFNAVFGGKKRCVVFDKSSLDVYVDGERVESESEFAEEGTEQRFVVDGQEAAIAVGTSTKKTSLGKGKAAVTYTLRIDGARVPAEGR